VQLAAKFACSACKPIGNSMQLSENYSGFVTVPNWQHYATGSDTCGLNKCCRLATACNTLRFRNLSCWVYLKFFYRLFKNNFVKNIKKKYF